MSSSGRRPGRVQKIASDGTPIDTPRVDVDARLGWLLAMSRLHHPDPSFGDGQFFTQALNDAGISCSRSLVSRWESGEIAASYDAISGYEQVLALTPARLTSAAAYLRAAHGGSWTRSVRPAYDVESPEFADALDALLDRVVAGDTAPGTWLELGWRLAAVPTAYLPAATWRALAQALLPLLARGTRSAFRELTAAALNLCENPRARPFLTEALEEFLTDPAVQVVLVPLTLLDRLPNPSAGDLTLRLLEEPHGPRVFHVAVWLAARKVTRREFTVEQRARLDMWVLERWRSDRERVIRELPELVATLPEALRGPIARAAAQAGESRLTHVTEHAEEVRPSDAHDFARHMARTVRGQVPTTRRYEPDRLLTRQVREALFHGDSERRHLAACLLCVSPFHEPLAQEVLAVVTDPSRPALLRTRCAGLAQYLCTEAHRPQLEGLLDDPEDGVALPVIETFGHLAFSRTSDLMLRRILTPEETPRGQAAMHSLGLTGSPVLPTLVAKAKVPAWQSAAARWWLDIGPAIRP